MNAPADPAPPVTERTVQVLVAEPEPEHIAAIRAAFAASELRAELVFVATLAEFREYRGEATLDLALVSLQLPDGCGLEALPHPPEQGDFPVLIMGSEAGEELAVAAIKRGALDFIVSSAAGYASLPRKAERALREWRLLRQQQQVEERLQLQSAALDAAENTIVITDRNGVIQWVNPAFTTLTGYTPAEAIGRAPADLLKSGEHDAKFYQQLWETILAGRVWRGEFINRRKDGTRITEESVISPVRNRQGVITHFICIKRDITEHRALEARMLRSQRLESLGRLASGMAHDLNNILAPIIMAAAMLRDQSHGQGETKLVDIIEHSANRGAEILRQLLTFGRGSAGQRVAVSLPRLVRDMVALMQETFPRNLTFLHHLPTEVWGVTGDPTQLHQVLMNLCVNARDAMPKGGMLTLSLVNVELDEARSRRLPGARPGRYVKLSVMDNGTGIPPEILDQIFDPFFTTKKTGDGTGLGLSTVMGIVKSHGGFVHVSSQVGCGSEFEVYLPAQPAASAEASRKPGGATAGGNGETLLLVDDEEGVRTVFGRLLQVSGYRVIEAKDGADALARLAENLGQIRVIVTDLMMPVMDGPDFVRAAHRIKPALKFITVSGLSSNTVQSIRLGEMVTAQLTKPFSGSDLLDAVRRALSKTETMS